MMQATLRALSNSSTQLNGAVTFVMFPYRTLASDPVIDAFERIEPRFEYVDDRTGECTHDEPEQYAKDVERARKVGAFEVASHWKRNGLWGVWHISFLTFERFVIDLEFNSDLNAPLRGLALYWQQRDLAIPERWQLFKSVISPDVIAAIDLAYAATRDETFAAPTALGDTGGEDEAKKKPTSTPKPRSSAKSKG